MRAAGIAGLIAFSLAGGGFSCASSDRGARVRGASQPSEVTIPSVAEGQASDATPLPSSQRLSSTALEAAEAEPADEEGEGVALRNPPPPRGPPSPDCVRAADCCRIVLARSSGGHMLNICDTVQNTGNPSSCQMMRVQFVQMAQSLGQSCP